MIYFDNAATTYPKPMAVTNAVRTALQKYGANPGRSGHKMSMAAAEEEYRCRVAAANLFHAEGPENVAFTINSTHANKKEKKQIGKNARLIKTIRDSLTPKQIETV